MGYTKPYHIFYGKSYKSWSLVRKMDKNWKIYKKKIFLEKLLEKIFFLSYIIFYRNLILNLVITNLSF